MDPSRSRQVRRAKWRVHGAVHSDLRPSVGGKGDVLDGNGHWARPMLAQGELDERLLIPASEERRQTAKKQHREVKQGGHGAQDSA